MYILRLGSKLTNHMASFRLILSKWGIVECLIVSGMYIHVPYKFQTYLLYLSLFRLAASVTLAGKKGGTQEGWNLYRAPGSWSPGTLFVTAHLAIPALVVIGWCTSEPSQASTIPAWLAYSSGKCHRCYGFRAKQQKIDFHYFSKTTLPRLVFWGDEFNLVQHVRFWQYDVAPSTPYRTKTNRPSRGDYSDLGVLIIWKGTI